MPTRLLAYSNRTPAYVMAIIDNSSAITPCVGDDFAVMSHGAVVLPNEQPVNCVRCYDKCPDATRW